MKKNKLATTVRFWGVLPLICCSLIMSLSACSGDDEPSGNGIDDLAYLQQRIAAEDGKVYGLRLGTDASDIVSRPVATVADAQDEFYKLVPGGASHEGITTTTVTGTSGSSAVPSSGVVSCRLTAADGKPQGTISFHPSPSTLYYCAEVVFSSDIQTVTGVGRVRYILYDRWPEEGNGFMKDILDNIKK